MKKAVLRQRNQAVLELDVVIYVASLNIIGGIESWLYYVAKKYNIGQIVVLYKKTFEEQIERLSPHIKLIQYTGQRIKCNKIIFTEPRDYQKELYDCAEERFIVLHCNYDNSFDYRRLPKMDKIYAVSDVAKECFEKVQEQEVFTLYNPVAIDKPQKLLKLISATRLTQEKGYERMVQLSEELERKKIPYIWLIFTDRPTEPVSNNIIFMKPRYNMSDYMVNADYGVQLSSKESYCLFVQECLKLKVPVIITDLPVYKELGITKKEAHILKLDMSNLDVEKIYNKIPKVNYTVPVDSDSEYKELLEVE